MDSLSYNWRKRVLQYSSPKRQFSTWISRRRKNSQPDEAPFWEQARVRSWAQDIDDDKLRSLEPHRPRHGGELSEVSSSDGSALGNQRQNESGTNREQYEAKIMQLKCDVENLFEQLESTRSELANSQQDMEDCKKHIFILNQEQHDLRLQLQLQLQLQQTQNIFSQDKEEAKRQLLENAVKLKTQEGELRRSLDLSEKNSTKFNERFERREAETAGSRAFLTPDDLHSGADVIQMVNALNEEIFRLAEFAANMVENDEMASTEAERDMNLMISKEWLSNARQNLGHELYSYLAEQPSQIRKNATIFQLATQSLLVGWCEREIELFSPHRSPFEEGLEILYQGIKLGESQIVSGRWRAMTSKALYEQESVGRTVLDVIVALLYVCGWSSSRVASENTIFTMMQMISTLEDHQFRLKKAITQEITTTEMKVFAHERGVLFQKDMEDIYQETIKGGRGVEENPRHVLCTVGLGLRTTTTMRGERHEYLLLKAKVALDEVLFYVNKDDDEGIYMPEESGKEKGSTSTVDSL